MIRIKVRGKLLGDPGLPAERRPGLRFAATGLFIICHLSFVIPAGILWIGGFVCLADAAVRGKLRITADSLVYLEKGNITEFRRNVKFSRGDFEGRSSFLKLNKKRQSLFASGGVYSVVKSTSSGFIEIWTERLLYKEKTGALSSPLATEFLVHVATHSAAGNSYRINCAEFKGFVPRRLFRLKGKPVKIKGENLSGYSDVVDVAEDVVEMRGNAYLKYTEDDPYEMTADFIKVNLKKEIYEFTGGVKGFFYIKNAEDN